MLIQRSMLMISRTCIATIKNVKCRDLQLYFWLVKTGKIWQWFIFWWGLYTIITLVKIDGSRNSDTYQVFQPKTWLPLPGGHRYSFRLGHRSSFQSNDEPNILLNQNISASRNTKSNVLQWTFQSLDLNPTEKSVVWFEKGSQHAQKNITELKMLRSSTSVSNIVRYYRKCCYSL